MKRILLLFTAALLTQINWAQQSSNLIIFAEQATPFYAIVNGIKQNPEPETNVKITGLTNPANQVKIIFEDQNIPAIDKKVYFQEMNVETTMRIAQTKKGFKLKYFGEVPMGTATADASQHVIVYHTSETPAPTTSTINHSSTTPDTQVTTPTATTTTVVEETTTVTSTSAPNNVQTNTSITETSTTQNTGDDVNVSLNAGGFGFNMNVNVNDNGGSTTVNSTTMNDATSDASVGINESSTVTTTTTTTTVTSTEAVATEESNFSKPVPVVEPVYYVDGYTGTVGCAIPESGIKSLVTAIESESFSEDKLIMAKQATKNKCLTTDQVVEICNLFSFDDDKLAFAKHAYSRTYDVDNYYKVNSVFSFSSSKEELSEYINK